VCGRALSWRLRRIVNNKKKRLSRELREYNKGRRDGKQTNNKWRQNHKEELRFFVVFAEFVVVSLPFTCPAFVFA
jgi:hypothetical protein